MRSQLASAGLMLVAGLLCHHLVEAATGANGEAASEENEHERTSQDQESSRTLKHKYCVVGAGPAGVQLGHLLNQAGMDYTVFERGAQTDRAQGVPRIPTPCLPHSADGP